MAEVEAKTRFQINGTIDMWLTSLNWPIYRGAKHVPVTVYQPGEMYEVLADLKYSELGHSLDVTCNGPGGQPYNIRIHGVFVIDVQKIHDGEDGVRVVFADRRYLLNHRVMDESWGILFQGKYLAETAQNSVTAWKLADALEKFILPDFPFKDFTRQDWREPFDKTGLDMRIPNDILSAGKAFAPALDALLDYWGFDLAVDTEGQFYFADRIEDARGQRETSANVGGGFAWIRDHTGEMEWILREPDFSGAETRFQAMTPEKFKVKFWEDHTLQVPFGGKVEVVERTISSSTLEGRKLATATGQHGLQLRQVYEALGGFYTYKNMLRAYGEDPRKIGDQPRRVFNKPNMADTKLATGKGTTSSAEQEIRFTIQEVIRASERTLYAITHKGGGGFPAAWTSMKLGKLSVSGNIDPQKVVGDWTEIFRKVVGHAFPQLPELIPAPIGAILPSGPVRGPIWQAVLDYFRNVGKRSDEWKEGSRVSTLKIPLAIIYTVSRLFDGADTPTILEEEADLEEVGQPAFAVEKRRMDEASALGVKWKAAPAAIVELTSDQRRVKGRSDTVIGVPLNIPVLIIKNIAAADTKASGFKRFVARNQLKGASQIEDMAWDLLYTFWIKLTARRNAPNSDKKFWIEEVSGPDGAGGPEMEMEADPATPARRAEVDYIRQRVSETQERNRPNGNDGFGKILNRKEVEEEAERRVRNKIAEMTADAAFSHDFMNIEILARRTLMGALDSFMLKLSGSVVFAEMNTGVRGQEETRRSEAERRSLQTEAEVQGKLVRR